MGYDSAFTFVYSPRRETTAADLPGQVPHEVKRERMERLVEVIQRRAHERAQRFVGRTMEVLVEGTSRTDEDRLRGRTRHNKAVNFTGWRSRATWSTWRSSRPPARRWPAPSGCSPASPERGRAGDRHVRPHRGRQDRAGAGAGRPAARARRRPGGHLGGRAPGLPGPGDAHRAPTQAERERLEHRLVGFVPLDRGVLGGPLHGARARRGGRRAGGRAARRSWSAAPGCTCARRWPSWIWRRRPAGAARRLEAGSPAGARALHADLAGGRRAGGRRSIRATASAWCARWSCWRWGKPRRARATTRSCGRPTRATRRCWWA